MLVAVHLSLHQSFLCSCCLTESNLCSVESVHTLRSLYATNRCFPLQSPKALIALFNSVVCHMAEHVTHPDLAAVSWPLIECTSPDEGTVGVLISDLGSQFLYYTGSK